MGNAGRKRFERFFTMRQFEQNMVNILETVISKQKSTSKELQ
jgi:hypothetical protein